MPQSRLPQHRIPFSRPIAAHAAFVGLRPPAAPGSPQAPPRTGRSRRRSSHARSRRASAPALSPWPIAFRTWLGPTLPDEQAEPADSATPARSKAICAVSALMPGMAKKTVLARRSALRPKISASGASLRSRCLRSGRASRNVTAYCDSPLCASTRRRAEAGDRRQGFRCRRDDPFPGRRR